MRIYEKAKSSSRPTVLTNCVLQNMRMKMVCADRTLREVAGEFLALKKAQKIRERTVSDYQKYISKFLISVIWEQVQISLGTEIQLSSSQPVFKCP